VSKIDVTDEGLDVFLDDEVLLLEWQRNEKRNLTDDDIDVNIERKGNSFKVNVVNKRNGSLAKTLSLLKENGYRMAKVGKLCFAEDQLDRDVLVRRLSCLF